MVSRPYNLADSRYLNIYYRRTRRLDSSLITDLRIVPDPTPETLKDELDGWVQAEGDLHSGTWPSQPTLRLWYKLSGRARQEITAGPISEIDVIYGDDDPFYGFQRVGGGKITEAEAKRWESVDLAIKRGSYTPPKAARPVFNAQGNFKIMQSESRCTHADPSRRPSLLGGKWRVQGF